MDLDELIAGLDVRRVSAVVGGRARAVRVCDITEDSRTVMPGSLFIARKGEKADGRAFVPGAIAAGAGVILTDDPKLKLPSQTHAGSVEHPELLIASDLPLAIAQLGERFYGEPSKRLHMVGVTGTNGKTTITWLIHQILNALDSRCGLIGTVVVDDGTEVATASLTTPPALEVSRTLGRMVDAGCRACAMETSSHSLDQRRVGAVHFRTGVFTNLTHDHLDYHGTMEKYADAKAMLFASLPTATEGGLAIVNGDDPASRRMLRDCKARVEVCTLKSRHSAVDDAAWRGTINSMTLAGSMCTVRFPAGAFDVKLPFIGAHNLMNAMQAAAVVVGMGFDPAVVFAHLEKCGAPPGRLEGVTAFDDPIAVYVDYAHTDDALSRVLAVARATLTKQGTGRLIVVFGCGGDRDQTKRPKMGKVAASLADRAIITSDNPRREEPRVIVEQILAGVEPRDRAKVVIEQDREKAIGLAIAEAQVGDLVLIAGKGHEDYQIVSDGRGGTVKLHFDDREVARGMLAKRGDVPSMARGPVAVVATHLRPASLKAAGRVTKEPRRHGPGGGA